MAGATILAALAAVFASVMAVLTLRQMRRDSIGQREDSARATRPYVHVRIVPSIGGLDSWDLVIRNAGRTPARNLSLRIDAPDAPTDAVTSAVYRFAAAGQTLQPDTSLRMYWSLEASREDRDGFARATLTARYEDIDGQRYEEMPVVLDPKEMGETPAPGEGGKQNGLDTNIPMNTLYTLRAIARHIGEGNR